MGPDPSLVPPVPVQTLLSTRGEAFLQQGELENALRDCELILMANSHHVKALAIKGDNIIHLTMHS